MAPYFVYFYFDTEGRLLYVGVTSDFRRRDRLHSRMYRKPNGQVRSPWYINVATSKVREYSDKHTARAMEARFIRRLHPIHNVHHRGADVLEAA